MTKSLDIIFNNIEYFNEGLDRFFKILNEIKELGESPTLIELYKVKKFPLGVMIASHTEFMKELNEVKENVEQSRLSKLEDRWTTLFKEMESNNGIVIEMLELELEYEISILESRAEWFHDPDSEAVGDTLFRRSIVFENMKLLEKYNSLKSEYSDRIKKIDELLRESPKIITYRPSSYEENPPKEYWWYYYR